MKPDLYTKAVLTVIAFMLVMIGCPEYVSPSTAVKAEGPFANVTFSVYEGTYSFFDSRTGEIWEYGGRFSSHPGAVDSKFRLSQLGQPLTKEK